MFGHVPTENGKEARRREGGGGRGPGRPWVTVEVLQLTPWGVTKTERIDAEDLPSALGKRGP